MSEIPANPSTTPESQKITQSGLMPLPDINFTLKGKVQLGLDIDPEILLLLKRIFSRLPDGEKTTSEIVSHALEVENEPAELSVGIPDDSISPFSWKVISEYPRFRWVDEGSCVAVGYYSSSFQISWSNVRRLVKLPKKERMIEIKKLPVVGDSSNRRTAVSILCTCIETGIIKDPDADFMPMLNSYSTKPDDNCGKVEGTLEE